MKCENQMSLLVVQLGIKFLNLSLQRHKVRNSVGHK
jgi:hypothetical protein